MARYRTFVMLDGDDNEVVFAKFRDGPIKSTSEREDSEECIEHYSSLDDGDWLKMVANNIEYETEEMAREGFWFSVEVEV